MKFLIFLFVIVVETIVFGAIFKTVRTYTKRERLVVFDEEKTPHKRVYSPEEEKLLKKVENYVMSKGAVSWCHHEATTAPITRQCIHVAYKDSENCLHKMDMWPDNTYFFGKEQDKVKKFLSDNESNLLKTAEKGGVLSIPINSLSKEEVIKVQKEIEKRYTCSTEVDNVKKMLFMTFIATAI